MMSTTHAAAPRNDVERLLQEIAASNRVQFRVDSDDGLFLVWLTGKAAPQCGCHADTWWTAGSEGWNLMARFDAIRRVRFVREPDAHVPGLETLSIRFAGANGAASLRASFTPLYDEQNQPIATQFARWEELRANYGGRDELRVEHGSIVS
jgi:hypothetical protein